MLLEYTHERRCWPLSVLNHYAQLALSNMAAPLACPLHPFPVMCCRVFWLAELFRGGTEQSVVQTSGRMPEVSWLSRNLGNTMRAPTLLIFGTLLLTVIVCHGWLFDHFEERYQETDDVSLWPLPQKYQTTPTTFKLSASTFQIVHAKDSSAGPSCSLLQNAFRR